MNQFQQLLAVLTLRQKLTIAVVLAVVGVLLQQGVKWNKERDLRPLFSRMDAEDAGVIVERLRASGVEYKIGEGGTILVPSERVSELRLELAAAGLPRTGRMGFELFDRSNLGSTDFAEQVTFRRALEGELERSVMSLAEVEKARVHLTFPKDSVFVENRQPAKASVMIKLKPGARLSGQNVSAITYLTASAVEGLAPEAVTVIDMAGNLLSRPRAGLEESGATSSAMQEYRQGLEREMLAKIRATLDPLLGEDKYRAGVSIECDFRTAEQSEEQFDPDRSVMVSAQKTEDLSGAAAAAGVPGTASNLPRAAPKSPTSGGGVARRTENIHYQTSRVVKHTKMPQGSIQRISVAVLVDHALRWEGEGDKASRVLEPPSPERLKVLREVLSGVIGFRQDRGDQILVESLPFEATLRTPPPAQEPREAEAPGQPSLPPWFTSLFTKAPAPLWIGAAVCLLMVGVVAVWWLRRVVRRGKPKVSVESAAALGGSHAPDALAAAADFERKVQQQLASNEQERERQEAEVLSALKLPVHTKKSEVLKKQLSEEAKKDPAAMAQLIRTWLNEAER